MKFLFILSSIVVFGLSLHLKVHNPEVLHIDKIGLPLDLELSMHPNDYIFKGTLLQSLCLAANGRICHCYDNFNKSTIIYYPKVCSDMFKNDDIKQNSIGLELLNRYKSYFSVVLKFSTNYNETYMIASQEYLIQSTDIILQSNNQLITLVLPLILDDLPRSLILLHTLKIIPHSVVLEMLIIVPTNQYHVLNGPLKGAAQNLTFPITVIDESDLFLNPSNIINKTFPYALQMAIKLLISKWVKTEYYLTLDADLLLCNVLNISKILIPDKVYTEKFRGIYQYESQNVHKEWWKGSREFLRLNNSSESYNGLESIGFSVTPALLSTYGSILAIGLIQYNFDQVYKNDNSVNNNDYESDWLNRFGNNNELWSEYTIYRLALEHFHVFDVLHIEENEVSSIKLHCNDVFFEHDLPWDMNNSFDRCIFSVLQSSIGFSPGIIFKTVNDYIKL
eukprot:gene8611-11640_t